MNDWDKFQNLRKGAATTSDPKARQGSSAEHRAMPATQREIERAFAADIDSGIRINGGAVSPGGGMVKAINDTEKAMDALVGSKDKSLTVKDIVKLRAGKRATVPRAKLLLAVARINDVMRLPCRLGEPLELLRQYWQRLELLGQLVAQDNENGGEGQGLEVMCRSANALMDELREHAGHRRYLDRRRHRLLQVGRNFASMTQLLDSVLQEHGQIRVVVMEFAHFRSRPQVAAVDFGSLVRELVRNRSRLLDCCRNSETLDSAIAAYIWHLSYDFEVGPFMRIYFLLKTNGLGEHQKFIARAGRTWKGLSQGVGVWRCEAAHTNPIVAAAHGVVTSDSVRRVKEAQRAFWYEVQKDEWLRIWLPEKQRAFGMSEVKKGASLSNAWGNNGERYASGAFGLFKMCGEIV